MSNAPYYVNGVISKSEKKSFLMVVGGVKPILVQHPFFLPLQERDHVTALVTGNPDSVTTLIQRPLVTFPRDESALHSYFYRALAKSETKNVKRLINDIQFDNISIYYQNLDKYSCTPPTKNDNKIGELLPSFSRKQLNTLLRWWKKNRVERMLNILGITSEYRDLVDLPHDEIRDRALNNPYRLYFIPQNIADDIVKTYPCTFSPPTQEGSAPVLYSPLRGSREQEQAWGVIGRKIAYYFYREKHTCINLDFAQKIVANYDFYAPQLDFVQENNCVFLPDRIKIIKSVVETLVRKLKGKKMKYSHVLSPQQKDKFSPDQLAAIQLALQENVCAISGPAGTGKTTVIREIVETLVNVYGKKCILTSFTGRAVSRMRSMGMHLIGSPSSLEEEEEGETPNETTKTPKPETKEERNMLRPVMVATMHLMITMQPSLHQIDYVIFDETSMITTPLFHRFMRYVIWKNGYCPRLVFVGDNNQLEPIDWGSLFVQIMDCKEIPKAFLEINHRSCKSILHNANAILKNAVYAPDINVVMRNEKQGLEGFTIVNDDPVNVYFSLVKEKSDYENIRIITPYREEVEKVNSTIQQRRYQQNPAAYAVDHKGSKWYEGDLVVMKKNNYDLDVMNGDEGMVVIITAEQIGILFNRFRKVKDVATAPLLPPPAPPSLFSSESEGSEEKREQTPTSPSAPSSSPNPGSGEEEDNIKYFLLREPPTQVVVDDQEDEPDTTVYTSLLNLGYAMTADASQGSEYPTVLVHLPTRGANQFFTTRNRVYTAVTRGKSLVIGTGDTEVFETCKRTMSKLRNDMLGAWITEEMEKWRGENEAKIVFT